MLDNSHESYTDKVLRSGSTTRARTMRNFGKSLAIAFNAATSFGFGYYFIRPVLSDATIFGASVAGLVGGVAAIVLTDGMSRIWNITRLQASESEGQHEVATSGYWFSVIVSVLMTLVYSIVVVFGADATLSTTSAQATLIGRILVTVVAVAQLVFWLMFENKSPHYKRSLVRTITAARFNDAILDAEAEAIDKARDEARQLMAPYVPGLASQIAHSGAQHALRTLAYKADDVEQLPPLREVAPTPPTPPTLSAPPQATGANFTNATQARINGMTPH